MFLRHFVISVDLTVWEGGRGFFLLLICTILRNEFLLKILVFVYRKL